MIEDNHISLAGLYRGEDFIRLTLPDEQPGLWRGPGCGNNRDRIRAR